MIIEINLIKQNMEASIHKYLLFCEIINYLITDLKILFKREFCSILNLRRIVLPYIERFSKFPILQDHDLKYYFKGSEPDPRSDKLYQIKFYLNKVMIRYTNGRAIHYWHLNKTIDKIYGSNFEEFDNSYRDVNRNVVYLLEKVY